MSVSRAAVAVFGVLAAAACHTGVAVARDHTGAPPLPPPGGTVVNVSTVAQLQNAVQGLASNTTIVVAAGTYNLTSTLWVRPSGSTALANVGIRGATGDPADVVLRGLGMSNSSYGNVPHGIHVGNVNGITIADLTIRDVWFHPIQLAGELGCRAPRIYNCRLIDAGEQFIKGSVATPGAGVDAGIVEYTLMEYTTTARSNYTNGVDVLGGDGWTIRHNLFRRILAPPGQGLAGPAVLMWRQSADTVCEGNRFVDCAWGIAFGLDPQTPGDHTGGVIRNNFISRGPSTGGDVGIAVFHSPGTRVLNNTVILRGTYPNAVEYRFSSTTGVEIRQNLTDAAIVARDGASATVAGNVTNAQASWFVNASGGDLHLVGTATNAIDRAAAHASVTDDYDGAARPRGAAPDLGADEFGNPTVTGLSPGSVPAGSGAFPLSVSGSGFGAGAVVRLDGQDRPTSVNGSTELVASIAAADVAVAGVRTIAVFDPTAGLSNGVGLTVTGVNPVPAISLLSPASIAAGSSGLTLTVDGSGFVPGSVVRLNASDRPTTFVGSTRLTAEIPAADLAAAASWAITVASPGPGGGTSNAGTLVVFSGGPGTPPPAGGGTGSPGGTGGGSGGGGGGGSGCALGAAGGSPLALLPYALGLAALGLGAGRRRRRR